MKAAADARSNANAKSAIDVNARAESDKEDQKVSEHKIASINKANIEAKAVEVEKVSAAKKTDDEKKVAAVAKKEAAALERVEAEKEAIKNSIRD